MVQRRFGTSVSNAFDPSSCLSCDQRILAVVVFENAKPVPARGRGEEKFVLPMRICLGCGEEFQPARITQFHHSNGGLCRMRARRKRLRAAAERE
jgi:hypothetical protein